MEVYVTTHRVPSSVWTHPHVGVQPPSWADMGRGEVASRRPVPPRTLAGPPTRPVESSGVRTLDDGANTAPPMAVSGARMARNRAHTADLVRVVLFTSVVVAHSVNAINVDDDVARPTNLIGTLCDLSRYGFVAVTLCMSSCCRPRGGICRQHSSGADDSDSSSARTRSGRGCTRSPIASSSTTIRSPLRAVFSPTWHTTPRPVRASISCISCSSRCRST